MRDIALSSKMKTRSTASFPSGQGGWLTCVIWLVAMALPKVQADEAIKLIFPTGTVTVLQRGDVVDVDVTGLGCSTKVRSTVNLTSVAESFISSGFREEDIFYTDIALMGNHSTVTVQGFAAIKKSTLGLYQYLPYRAQDVGKILYLTSRTNMTREAMKFKNLTIDLPFTPSCPSILEGSSDLVWSSGVMTETEVTLMMAILLEAVSYNRFIKAMDEYFICKLEVKYTDMPWVFRKCCREATHDIYDSDSTRKHVLCQEPDQLRQALSQLAMLIGSICFLSLPLLITYAPEDPYERKRQERAERKEKAVSNKSSATRDETAADECVLDVGDTKRQANPDAEAGVRCWPKNCSAGDRIHLNRHPEYTFTLGTVLAYALYLPPRHRIRSLVYRFLIMAIPRFLSSWLWLITNLYYESVLKDNPALMAQGLVHESLFWNIYSEEYDLMQRGEDTRSYYISVDRALLVYVPLIATVVNMVLLYFLVVRPRDVCQALAWMEEERAKAKDKKWDDSPKEGRSYPEQLSDNLKHRLSRLLTKSFWNRWWDDSVCRFSPLFRSRKDLAKASSLDIARQSAYLLVLFPVQLVYVLLLSLPSFAVFNNLYSDPAAFILSGCCVSSNKYVKLVLLVMAVVMTATGVILWYWVILELCWFGAYIILFLCIDILRNASTTLSAVVFACSVVLYVTKASKDFEETYRQLKLNLFTLVEKYPGNYVLKSDGQTQLWTRDPTSGLSIPRRLFDEVVQRYHPYEREVLKTLKRLLLTLLVLAFLFTIVIKLQIFHELTTTDEGVLMAAIAGIPALLGMKKSDTERELYREAILQDMGTMIENLFEQKEDNHSE